MAVPRAGRDHVRGLRRHPDLPVARALALRLRRARHQGLDRNGELCRALGRRGVLDLAPQQRGLARALSRCRAAGALHRDLPQPDGAWDPGLQVPVLLSLRDLAGRRRAHVLVVLRAQLRALLQARGMGHGIGRGGARGRTLRNLRHHRGRALAADRLRDDPLPHRAQQRGAGPGGGGTPRRGEGLADALVRDPAATAPCDLHRGGGHGDRRAAVVRPRVHHDRGRAIRGRAGC